LILKGIRFFHVYISGKGAVASGFCRDIGVLVDTGTKVGEHENWSTTCRYLYVIWKQLSSHSVAKGLEESDTSLGYIKKI